MSVPSAGELIEHMAEAAGQAEISNRLNAVQLSPSTSTARFSKLK
jgi:hypothetical protein